MWALLCATAPLMRAQEPFAPDSTASDTMEYSISPRILDEIVVTVTSVINKTDRIVVRPDKEILYSSTDGVDLLRKLQLPGISVNPLTGDIVVTGDGNVVLCINGVEVTSGQISAINPRDILRIEYHDNPGVRYAGASAVIDYITVRHESGGTLMLDTFGAFARGKYASIDHLAGQYNRGHSVWDVNIGFMGQQKDRWIRDYDEIWHYPDETVEHRETGLPVKVGAAGLESAVNYNYLHPCGDMFNLRLGLDFTDVPDMEQGDRHTVLETSVSDTKVIVTEHTEEHSVRPNIGLYYLHKMKENQNVTFDLQGSFLRSRMMHTYAENGIGEINRVNGNKYAVKFTGMYENRKGSRVWSIGISNSGSAIRNVYLQTGPVKVDVTQIQSALIGEYSNRSGKWGTIFNLRTGGNYLKQDSRSIRRFFFLPGASISYCPSPGCFMRYSASLDCMMPEASEISAVIQPVQTGMIRRGNPALSPFRVIDQSFIVSLDTSPIFAKASVEYRNEHNPIMESVIFENGGLVRTYFNQRSFQRLRTGISLTVRPWKKYVSITVEPVSARYFSHGSDYSHCHTISRIGWSLDFNYRNWLFYAKIMSGPENKMYGEEIIEEKDMNQIMTGYKGNKWTIQLGFFNAFMRNYWMETRNLSALAPYRSKAYSGRSSSYIAIKFNLSLGFGRKGRSIDVPETDRDNNSGILTGTK